MPTEPFVSAEEAASFLAIKRRYLLALARNGIAGARSLPWSELIVGRNPTMGGDDQNG